MTEEEVSTPAWLEVRRNFDQVVRRDPKPWDFFGEFIWSDGNYACDCNRALFFSRAAGEADLECGCGSSAFSVRLIAVDDGEVLYEEDDWVEPANKAQGTGK